MRKHGDILNCAIGKEANHNLYRAAKAGCNRFNCIANRTATHLCRVNFAAKALKGLVVRHIVKCRHNFAYGIALDCRIYLIYRIFSECVKASYKRRRDKAYSCQHHYHIFKRRFYSHYFTLPNLFGKQYILIRGTVAFIIRIANETPSG